MYIYIHGNSYLYIKINSNITIYIYICMHTIVIPHFGPKLLRISIMLRTINQHFTPSLVSVWLHAKGGHQAIEVSGAAECPTATRATTDAIAALFVGAVGTDARHVHPTGELGRRQSIHQVFRRLKAWILLIPWVCPNEMIWILKKINHPCGHSLYDLCKLGDGWLLFYPHYNGLEMPEKNLDLLLATNEFRVTGMSLQWTGPAKLKVTHSRWPMPPVAQKNERITSCAHGSRWAKKIYPTPRKLV